MNGQQIIELVEDYGTSDSPIYITPLGVVAFGSDNAAYAAYMLNGTMFINVIEDDGFEGRCSGVSAPPRDAMRWLAGRILYGL